MDTPEQEYSEVIIQALLDLKPNELIDTHAVIMGTSRRQVNLMHTVDVLTIVHQFGPTVVALNDRLSELGLKLTLEKVTK